jgi:hypothetical protein
VVDPAIAKARGVGLPGSVFNALRYCRFYHLLQAKQLGLRD